MAGPRGLEPKYFTLWKRKLRDKRPAKVPAAVVAIRLSLGNGISLSLEVRPG